MNSEGEQLDGEDRQCKNDVTIQDPTTSMSSLENSEARQKEMEEEIRCLRNKNASMEKVINSNSGFFGKNKRRVKYDLTPQDQLNRRAAVVFMKSIMFPRIQILPERWYLFCDDVDMTVCGKIVSLITIPDGWNKRTYWDDVFRSICSEGWAIIRSNYMVAVVDVFIGKGMEVLQMLPLFYLHIT